MKIKGISTVVASILILMIVIALGGTAYLFISGTFTRITSQNFEILETRYGILTVRNIGTASLTSLSATLDGQSKTLTIQEGNIQPGQIGHVLLNDLPATTGRHTGRLSTSTMSQTFFVEYPTIRVLAVYPCGCLIDDIVGNYGNKNGYPPIEVTCVQRDSFTATYDLSPYDVVAFDGADCWPGTISSGSEQNVKNFVNGGGGVVFSHDFFINSKHVTLQPVAGFSRVDGCCQTTAFNKLLDDTVANVPYVLPNPIPTQCTHGSGEVQEPTSREVYGDAGVYDHYFITYQYGSGRSVFSEWGHCAYDCGCGLWGGLPAADESKSLINAIYWAAGVS